MSNTLITKPGLLSRINIKLIVCMLLSFCAALGTVAYGYQFASLLKLQPQALLLTMGAVFAFSAFLANMMLGTYSLLNIKNDSGEKVQLPILFLSSVGAFPYGFLCYFGYQNTLPAVINITISIIVVLVNAGIGYTAIQNLWHSWKDSVRGTNAGMQGGKAKKLFQGIGFFIGLAISLLTYLAACSGITDLLVHYQFTTLVNYHAGFFLAILSWLPCAALFANANQIVAGDLFVKVSHFSSFLRSINLKNIAFFVFCLCSGTAIARMTSDSFSPVKQIPELFKADAIQMMVTYLIPISLFSSAALNYFSINKFFENIKKT